MAAIADAPAKYDPGGTMQATKPATEVSNGGGKLLDRHGETVKPDQKTTLMTKLNETSKEDVTLTKGMLAVGVGLIAFIGLAITCLVLFVGWVRADEGVKVNQGVMQKDIDEMRQDMRDMKQQFDEIQKVLQAQAVKDAETKGKAMGYDVGRTDGKAGH